MLLGLLFIYSTHRFTASFKSIIIIEMADSVGPQQEGTAFQDPNFIDVRSKVEGLEMELNGLSEELGKNIK